MTQLNSALDQIRAARKYTINLFNYLKPDDWIRQPSEGVTHIDWQVGHFAVASFHLALVQIRGKQPQNNKTIPENYNAYFGKGSTPDSVFGSRKALLDSGFIVCILCSVPIELSEIGVSL
jgi:hypothetical protein